MDNWSLWVDIKTLCLSPFKMLKRAGIAPVGHAPVGEAEVEFAGFGVFDKVRTCRRRLPSGHRPSEDMLLISWRRNKFQVGR